MSLSQSASLTISLARCTSMCVQLISGSRKALLCTLTHMAGNNESKIMTTNTPKSDICSRTIAHLRFSLCSFALLSIVSFVETYGPSTCCCQSAHKMCLLFLCLKYEHVVLAPISNENPIEFAIYCHLFHLNEIRFAF